jgi:hypothetical protein
VLATSVPLSPPCPVLVRSPAMDAERSSSRLDTDPINKSWIASPSRRNWILYSAIPLAYALGAWLLDLPSPDGLHRPIGIGFFQKKPQPQISHLFCIAFGLFLFPVIKYFFSEHSIYGLEHARLNIRIPPQAMWINMGYWKVALIESNHEILCSEFRNIGYIRFSDGMSGSA